jgi:hypothetical protein
MMQDDDVPTLFLLLWLLFLHATRNYRPCRYRGRACRGFLSNLINRCLYRATRLGHGSSILHFLHQRQVESFKSIQENRRVCLEFDALYEIV